MQAHTFLIQLVLILLAARVVGELAAWCKVPSVVGEVVAGIILGPSVFGWVQLTDPIHLLAQIGIILLLFEVGLETDVGKLTSSGLKASIVALGGVVLPFIGGFWVGYSWFQCTLLESLFIASTLTATSIGITLRVLRDLHKQNSSEAQVIIGAAVLDDIIGIVLLSVLFEFSTAGQVNWFNAGSVLLFILAFILLAPIAAKCVSITIKKWASKSEIPGLLPTAIISLILFFAWFAHELGAPELLGGFAAGLALSPQFILPFSTKSHQAPEFTHRVEKEMRSIIHFFTPLFFVAIGLSLNLRAINWSSDYIWAVSGSLTVVAIIGKILSGFLLFKESFRSKLIIGMAMVPRGEVGLIFANVGLTAGVLNDALYTALILVIIFTTFAAPFALRSIRKG